MNAIRDVVEPAAGIGADGHPPLPPEPAIKPLTIWRPSQFLSWIEPPGSHLLMPNYLTLGELTTLIGQGGLGKTRLALWLAICQILNRRWCGLETGGEPVKWLFLSDENGIARLRDDLRQIFSNLKQDEIARIDEFLRLQALLEMEDCDVWLGDPTTLARVKATIESQQPGAIVVDPLGNFAPGDISKPGEMKEGIRTLLGIIRRSAPRAAEFLLHHARTGRQNIAQGIGYDAGNFGSGGKALFAAARCQMNLMPGSKDDDNRLVLHCAKANNCQRFETRGIIFDQKTFTYDIDPDFDADAWLADVEGRTLSDQLLCTIADVVSAVQDGHTSTKDLVAHLSDAYTTSKRTIERLVSKALRKEGIKKLSRGHYGVGRNAGKLCPPTV